MMVWDEVDTAEDLWIVPADRMKAGKEHRVLSARALTVLGEAAELRQNDLVFPSATARPMSVTRSGVTPSPATSLPRRRAGGDPLAEAHPTTKPASSACVASAALARRSMCATPYGRSSSVGMGHPPSYTPAGNHR